MFRDRLDINLQKAEDQQKAEEAKILMDHFDIRLGEYLLKRLDINTLKLIGEGSFKFVFEVEDNELGKKVALYTLKEI